MRDARITPTRLIEKIGLDAARALVEEDGGRRLTIPSLDQFNAVVLRNSAMFSAYQRVGCPGGHCDSASFYKAMARDHRCSIDTVRRVIKNMQKTMKIVAPSA